MNLNFPVQKPIEVQNNQLEAEKFAYSITKFFVGLNSFDTAKIKSSLKDRKNQINQEIKTINLAFNGEYIPKLKQEKLFIEVLGNLSDSHLTHFFTHEDRLGREAVDSWLQDQYKILTNNGAVKNTTEFLSYISLDLSFKPKDNEIELKKSVLVSLKNLTTEELRLYFNDFEGVFLLLDYLGQELAQNGPNKIDIKTSYELLKQNGMVKGQTKIDNFFAIKQ
jgi:hypothetical protein